MDIHIHGNPGNKDSPYVLMSVVCFLRYLQHIVQGTSNLHCRVLPPVEISGHFRSTLKVDMFDRFHLCCWRTHVVTNIAKSLKVTQGHSGHRSIDYVYEFLLAFQYYSILSGHWGGDIKVVVQVNLPAKSCSLDLVRKWYLKQLTVPTVPVICCLYYYVGCLFK